MRIDLSGKVFAVTGAAQGIGAAIALRLARSGAAVAAIDIDGDGMDRLAGDALDILANGTMIAKGEVVMVGERFGVRFTEIVDPAARMESI